MSDSKSNEIKAVGKILNDSSKPLKDRFRALFTLRNIGGDEAIDLIANSFQDTSALLKHELAYCLGQMQDTYAIPSLVKVLEDKSQEAMVRHEAGEALGAIGSSEVLGILEKYSKDPVIEVAETCELAIDRIKWLENSKNEEAMLSANPYMSVDPAPPCVTTDVQSLKTTLLDEQLPLFERYRALFSLRNLGTDESVLALAEGLRCKSALFRHEIAYVLGQMQNSACVQQLTENLKDSSENPMVRHECAEALGSIASETSMEILKQYLEDKERVVKESCVVALDIGEYQHTDSFQYADTMAQIKQGQNLMNNS